MQKISQILIAIHANSDNFNNEEDLESSKMDADNDLPIPFAKVEFVNIGSPAHECGIKRGDLIVEFGTQNIGNFKSLMDIGALVQNCMNRNVRVKLIRDTVQVVTLNLVPKLWAGVGLLGCKLIPLKEIEMPE